MPFHTHFIKPILIVIACAATIAGVWFGLQHQNTLHTNPAIASLWTSTVTDTQGQSILMSRFQDKPILINVWAPWCAPCVEELPELSRLSTQDLTQGVQFIGLGVDTPEHIAAFTKQHPVQFPLYVASDVGLNFAKAMGNKAGALPFTALISAKGEIIAQKTGRVHAEEIITWIDKMRKLSAIPAK